MNEIWKDVPGYDGLYKASNTGNIKSLNYRMSKKEKILNPSVSGNGYKLVTLSKDGKSKAYSVHQVIAMTFLNHIPNGFERVINHINFIKTDNRVENLEIISFMENANKRKPRPINFDGVMPVLKNMVINEIKEFPIEKSQTVRITCSALKLSLGLNFTTKQVNDKGIIEVERVA